MDLQASGGAIDIASPTREHCHIMEKVLIVEDESIIAMALENQVRRMGYDVIGAVATGDAALEKVGDFRPDIVLMDIRIQGAKDGIDTAEAIRSHFKIPVIYLTAHADERTIQRAKVTEPLGYLVKPLREHELQAAITVALYKHKMNEALEQQKRNFLAMLTHDIKNPLQLVLGYADLLGEELKPAGMKQAENLLGQLRANILTIAELTTNYSMALAMEGGRFRIVRTPLQVNELLKQVSEKYAAEALNRGLSLETQMSQELPPIDVDRSALERVIANLVYNALRFTPRGGRVTLASALRDGAVVLSVSDTGRGVPPEEIPLLFEKYWQHGSDADQKGSGLGLFVVKSLVEAHGGKVEVESVLGRGTCFRVILPLATPLV
jgi:signal transduction histidine kinase